MRACMSLDVTSTASISLARETCASACSESRGRAGVFTCQNTIRDISPWMSLSRTKPTWRTIGPTAKETLLSGPAREGLALLQGLLVCGRCGRAITIRYQGHGGIYPVYLCSWQRRE